MGRILVIGDSCKDVHVYGKCERMCPDAPVPVFVPTKLKENLGMAGNFLGNGYFIGMVFGCKNGNVNITRKKHSFTNRR